MGTADDPAEMIARGKYVLSQFGPLGENTAFLVDGYVSGGTAITVARRNFPRQFLHYHRAGHGSVTSPQTQRGYTAFVHTKALACHGRQWHPCRYHEFRQDGGRCIRQGY